MLLTTQSRKNALQLIGLFLFNVWICQSAFATGTPELAPTNMDTISLLLNDDGYYNFARYGSSDSERLYINISNPNSEQVFLGFSRPTTDGHNPTTDRVDGFFRIMSPGGTIVYGPQRLSATTANISSYEETVAGPAPLGAMGAYTPFTFDPSGLAAGDYYIEFSQDSLVNSDELLITYFDITVATNDVTPVEIEGRVFSKNWGFFLPSIEKPSTTYGWFDRPFNGRFFVYTDDGFVSDINFLNSGFQPAAFNISMNSSGTGTSGDVLEDRKSLDTGQGNTVEYKIFLEEPDPAVYPSGTFGSLLTDSTTLVGCPQTGYFIKIVTTQQGVVEVLIDQNQASGFGVYDPGTEDVLLAIDVDDQLTDDTPGLYTRYIPWDGKDGLGNTVDPTTVAVPVEVTFSQGRYHIPVYDAEYNLYGFRSTIIRPSPPVDYVLKYYYDDTNIIDDPNIPGQGTLNSEGCVPVDSCHQWNNADYGNLNTINTYWFAKQEFQAENLNLILDCGEDRDGDGIYDLVDIDWDNDGIPNDLEYEGLNPTIDSDFDGTPNFEDEDFCTLNIYGICENLDPDNDGIPSFLDLDSDNDGIPDIVEAGGTDTDNDGLVDNTTDSDNDGLADTYDSKDNSGSSVNTSATSSDDCQTANGPSHALAFNTGITEATTDVTLTFSLEGDYGTASSETFSITGEGNYLIGSGYSKTNSDNTAYADCNSPGMGFTITIDKDAWNTWNDDGIVNLTIQASTAVNFCTNRSCVSSIAVNYGIPPAGPGTDIANADTDGDGVHDFLDLDSDNDGIADIIEVGGIDTDGNGMADDMTNPATGDTNNNGWSDTINSNVLVNGSLNDNSIDADSDNRPNHLDIDADNDGITDIVEAGGTDADNDGKVDTPLDADGDGLADVYDGAVTNGTNGTVLVETDNSGTWQKANGTSLDADGDGYVDGLDLDADNDGIPDIIEAGGVDTNGDGRADDLTDTDSDGLADTYDSNCTTGSCSPATTGTAIPNEDTDGDGILDYVDLDADNDGIPDIVEAGGIDSNGDGRVDLTQDDDEDGLADVFDENAADGLGGTGTNGVSLVETNSSGNWLNGSSGTSLDTDGDGRTDGLDLDADNDGIPDLVETGGSDDDGDGRVDTGLAPWDADGDGLADLYDQNAGDGPGNNGVNGTALVETSADSNNDGRVNNTETMIAGGNNIVNADTDNLPNHLDLDADNDGIVDILEAGGNDTNGDGLVDDYDPLTPNTFDTTDNDGWSPTYDGDAANDGATTTTGDGTPLVNTTDTNFDGIPEGYTTGDADGDTRPNFLDIDADDDGIVDNVEGQNTPDYTLPDNADADNDGIDDAYDNFVGFGGSGIDTNLADTEGTEYDHDADGTPDYLDNDSDNDNIPDIQEAWDNLADGDSQVDNTVGTCDGSDVDNDGLQDCFDSDTSSPLVTSYQPPVNDNGAEGSGTTASTPTSGDDPSDIFPNNDSGDGQPDFRDVLIDCGTPRVYYASTEASAGTTTDYEYDGTSHVDGADTKIVRATTFCTPGDGWFYFFNPLEPENYLFALKNSAGSPNTVPISELINFVEIKVEADRTNRHVIDGTQANLVMERDWNVALKGTPTPGSTFDVKFYFPPAEMDSLSAAADSVQAMANGTVTREFYWFGKDGGVANTDITSSTVTGMSDISANDPNDITDASADIIDGTTSTSGNGKNYVSFEGLTSLDGGSAGIKLTYTSLPVELIRFTANANDCEVRLDWEAGSEENFSHYEIEKSEDGRRFMKIGAVARLDNTTDLKYSFEDAAPNDRSYYRLKMIDLDATFEYSDVVVAETNCGEASIMKLYPNPVAANGFITIDLQTKSAVTVLVIKDLSGRTMKQFTTDTREGENTLRLDISDLPVGQYFMFNQQGGASAPVKFVVMNP